MPGPDFHRRLTAALALVAAGCKPNPLDVKGDDDDTPSSDVVQDTDVTVPGDSGDTSVLGDTAVHPDTDLPPDTGHTGDTAHTGDTGVLQPNASDLALLATCALPTTWSPTWPGGHLIEVTDCIVVPTADPCPDISTPLPWSPESPGNFCATESTTCVTSFVGRNDILRDTGWDTSTVPDSVNFDACCYTYVGPMPPYACGRPWVVDGVLTGADCVGGQGWSQATPCALPADPRDRAAALERWVADARAEHASIAAFARLMLDLLAHAAPADLIAGVNAAMGEEVRHATDAFSIASALAGEALTPGPLPIRTEAVPGLTELAVATAVEGGVGEMIAAATAAARLSVATDPKVREALARVVEEEARHAALAWRIVDWAIAAGGEPVRAAVDSAVAAAVAALPEPGAERVVLSHGLCGADVLRSAHAQVVTELLGLPLAA